MSEAKKKRNLRTGYIVFFSLVGIKIAEYLIATRVSSGAWPYLAALALVSAWIIIKYYKHFSQLWKSGGEDGE